MPSKVLAALIAVMLTANLLAQSATRTQITALPAGTKLDLHLKTGERTKGRLVSTNQDSFTINVGKAAAPRAINFDDVEKLTATHTPKAAWIATGAILAAVVIVIAAFAIERHNE